MAIGSLSFVELHSQMDETRLILIATVYGNWTAWSLNSSNVIEAVLHFGKVCFNTLDPSRANKKVPHPSRERFIPVAVCAFTHRVCLLFGEITSYLVEMRDKQYTFVSRLYGLNWIGR